MTLPAQSTGMRRTADEIRARLARGEKLSSEDGLVLTLLDALVEVEEGRPAHPLTGGLRGLSTCPHCGREFSA